MTSDATTAPLELALEQNPETYVEVHGALDEAVSDALLTAREIEVRTTVRALVASEVAPHAARVDRDHEFAQESYRALAAAGLVGLIFPEHLGGTGDSHVAYAIAMEEITAACAATSLIYMTQTHAAYPILTAGSEELARKYVPGLLNGTYFGSMAITEPDAGSDVSSMKTRAVAVQGGDAYRISGSKTFITTGDHADVVVCFVTTDPSQGREGVTAFVVETAEVGFSAGQPLIKMGMNGSSTAELFLSDLHVPATNRLGEEGAGWGIVMASVSKSRISAAAQGIGIARNAYARTLLALQQIHGNRLPDDLAFTLAELRGDILRARLLLLATARQVDETSQPNVAHIAMMKQVCTDVGWNVSIAAADLLGAYGDIADIGVERCLRDAKVTQIYDGTNEVQRLLIGRDTGRRFKEFM